MEPATPEAQLAAARALFLECAAATAEPQLVECAIAAMSSMLPGRALCVRAVDVRGRRPSRAYVRGAAARANLASEGIALTPAAVDRAQLKTAVAASARIALRERWDSPFTGIATGFTIPLAAAGELYGALDVGYGPGEGGAIDGDDEAALAPLAAHLALALRTLRLAEDATGLRDYQARLLDAAHALILGIDRNWRLTVCNRAICELVGRRRDELLGRDIRDFIGHEQRQHLTTALAAAINGQHHSAVTVMLPRTDGSSVRTVWSIAPVGRAGGPVEAVVAIGQDQSKIDELQHQVVRAERLATLGELAAGVVHELNNPLTSITVYAEYLVRKLEAAGSEASDVDKLRRIGASAQRILRFSRDLVQYARPSKKQQEPVDLASVVRQSVSICEHLVERGGIELSIEVDPELPVVQAVAGQIEQVLINLITNAVHATAEGGRVVVRATPQGPAAVLIEVGDSGPGVPDDDREKIFEPFFTTKPDGKGTGLGLPIVRNIIDEHRGTIAVDRSDLGGAAFRVILPIV